MTTSEVEEIWKDFLEEVSPNKPNPQLAPALRQFRARLNSLHRTTVDHNRLRKSIEGSLENKNFRIRLAACELMEAIACPEFTCVLLKASKVDTAESVKIAAARAAHNLPLSCVPYILNFLSDYECDDYLGLSVLERLGAGAVEPICNHLKKQAESSEPPSQGLIRVLGRIGCHTAGSTLEFLYRLAIDSSRSTILEAIASTGAPNLEKIAEHASIDAEWICRARAIEIAIRHSLQCLAPRISALTRDTNYSVRKAAREYREMLSPGLDSEKSVSSLKQLKSLKLNAELTFILDARNTTVPQEVAHSHFYPIREQDPDEIYTAGVSYLPVREVSLERRLPSRNEVYILLETKAVFINASTANSIARLDYPTVTQVDVKELDTCARTGKLQACLSGADASLVQAAQKEHRSQAESLPWTPVLICLPEDLRSSSSLVGIEYAENINYGFKRQGELQGLLDTILKEGGLPDPYSGFLKGDGSESWLRSEFKAVERAVQMGALRRLRAGPRKHAMKFEVLERRFENLCMDTGLFEIWLCEYGRKAFDKMVPILLRDNSLRGFYGPSLEALPFEFLDVVAKQLGSSLGVAVLIWNGFGQEWVDFWDSFEGGELRLGFLDYFAQFQECRRLFSSRMHRETGGILDCIVNSVNKDLHRRTDFFEPGGPEWASLTHCGVSTDEVADIARTFRGWEAATDLWKKVRMDGRSGIEDRSADCRQDPFEEGLYELGQRLETMMDLSEVDRDLDSLISILEILGVQFDFESRHVKYGSFQVEVQMNGGAISLKPKITMRTRRDLGSKWTLVFLHEIGHFLLHGRWMSEIQLMQHCSNIVSRTRSETSRAIENMMRVGLWRISRFYSAVEQSADGFAVRTLFSPSFVDAARAQFVKEDGIDIFKLNDFAALRLGLDPRGRWGDRDRFETHIRGCLGINRDPYYGLIPVSSKTIEAMEVASRRRVEELLLGMWHEVLNLLNGGDPCPLSKKRLAMGGRVSRPGLGFDGIVC